MPKKPPQLGLDLGEEGLLNGFEVFLIHPQASWPYYMAKVLHLVTIEVALLCLEGDPMFPE